MYNCNTHTHNHIYTQQLSQQVQECNQNVRQVQEDNNRLRETAQRKADTIREQQEQIHHLLDEEKSKPVDDDKSQISDKILIVQEG